MERPAVTDDVRLYLEAAAREPLLTKEQEVELAMAIERGKAAEQKLGAGRLRSQRSIARARKDVGEAEHARQRFIVANLRLVVSVARKYQGQGLPLLDLIQEGNIGLMRAVELFDWRRGFKFSTYATWWIRQAITRAIADRGTTIRLPVHVQERLRKAKSLAYRIQQSGRDPTPEEVGREMDLAPREVESLFELERRQPVSLETPVGEGTELGDLIGEAESEAPFDAVEDQLLRQEIWHTMDALLSDQQRTVLGLRYGLVNGEPLSLRETGRLMGLSAERVRLIEREAFGKLRESEVFAAASGF